VGAGDRIPWSYIATRVGTSTLTSNSATWTSSESAALITVTASLVSGLTYKVTATLKVNSSAAADVAFMRLREDTASGTQDDGVNVYMGTNNGNGFAAILYTEYTAAATGSKSWVVTGSRASGSGTQGIVCSVNRPCFLTVDLIVS
jgi:hypothetical protein